MNTKILITYKEHYEPIKNDILTPIQTGRAIAEEVFSEMLGDNSGNDDNISAENNKYSELSAVYWAWKNYEQLENPDYIGHMQYRRHFIFNENAKFDIVTPTNQLNGFSVHFVKQMDDDYIKNIGIDEETIQKNIQETDITVVKKSDVTYIGCKNSLEDYLKHVPGSRETDYDILKKVLLENHPDYQPLIDKFENEPYRHFYHMFIMRKEIFFEYCSFIFPLLKEIDSFIDYSYRGTRGGRVLGYLGEMLFALFIFKKQEEGKIIKELMSTVILNNKKITSSSVNNKIQKSNESCVVYNIENVNFIQFLCSLFSLDNCFADDTNYDVIIFYKNLDINYLKYLEEIKLNHFHNIRLESSEEFVLENETLDKYDFFRNLYFLRNYKNIVYLKSNIVFSNLVNFSEYKNKKIVLAKHPLISKIVNTNLIEKKHIENILELENIYDYCSDIIVIVNTSLIDFEHLTLKSISDLSLISIQADVINYMFKNEITYLPEKFLFENSVAERKKYFSDKEFHSSMNESTAIYYINNKLPINFLRFLRGTPFYEQALISRNITNNAQSELRDELANVHLPNINSRFSINEYNARLIYVQNNMGYLKFKKFVYKIKKALSSGTKQERYKRKYENVKQLIKDAKQLKKQFLTFYY